MIRLLYSAFVSYRHCVPSSLVYTSSSIAAGVDSAGVSGVTASSIASTGGSAGVGDVTASSIASGVGITVVPSGATIPAHVEGSSQSTVSNHLTKFRPSSIE